MRDRQEGAVAERPKSEPKRAEDQNIVATTKRTAETEEQRKAKREYLESILSPGVE